MKVLIVEPGQYPREAEIAKSLKAEQAVVGGLIECVYPWQDNACIVCNDEGKLEGLPLNRTLDDYDVIAGTFFVVGLTKDDFCSLTNEQVERYKAMFFKPQLFVPYRGGLMQVPYTNPDLPNTPEFIKQDFAIRHNLPELSFCAVEGFDHVMLVQYGKDGYWEIDAPPEGIDAKTYAERLNAAMGVTKQQQTAMLYGLTVGWDKLAYRFPDIDEQGRITRPRKNRDNKER